MRVEPSPGAFNTEQYDVYPGDNTPGPTVDTEFPWGTMGVDYSPGALIDTRGLNI